MTKYVKKPQSWRFLDVKNPRKRKTRSQSLSSTCLKLSCQYLPRYVEVVLTRVSVVHIYSFRHNIFLNKFVERFFVFDNCLLLVASTILQKYLEVPKTSNALHLFITGFSRKLLIKICENVIGPIYTRDGSSVQTDHPSRRIIYLV